ncbi:MAG: YlxR family protein [Oscillospiraceae bacterium]|nr:YlxR family protein [Oscillospiraceae bacterium]
MTQKKIPMRQCIGCGEMFPKRDLIRVVRPKEGEITLDLTGKLSGRGAYLCRSAECLRMAEKNHRLERSFSCRIPPEVYEVMANALTEAQRDS